VRRVIDRVSKLLRLIICVADLFMGAWSFPRAVPSRFDSHGVLPRTAPRLIWGSNSRSPTKQWASGYAPSNMQFFSLNVIWDLVVCFCVAVTTKGYFVDSDS